MRAPIPSGSRVSSECRIAWCNGQFGSPQAEVFLYVRACDGQPGTEEVVEYAEPERIRRLTRAAKMMPGTPRTPPTQPNGSGAESPVDFLNGPRSREVVTTTPTRGGDSHRIRQKSLVLRRNWLAATVATKPTRAQSSQLNSNARERLPRRSGRGA